MFFDVWAQRRFSSRNGLTTGPASYPRLSHLLGRLYHFVKTTWLSWNYCLKRFLTTAPNRWLKLRQRLWKIRCATSFQTCSSFASPCLSLCVMWRPRFVASSHWPLLCCSEILEKATKPSLISATLHTLLRFLNWIPLGYIFETSLIDHLINKASQPLSMAVGDRKFWPMYLCIRFNWSVSRRATIPQHHFAMSRWDWLYTWRRSRIRR